MLPREADQSDPAARLPEPVSLPLPAGLSRAGLPDIAGRTGGMATLPPGLASTPDALSLLKALRRRWLVALLLGLFAAGGAGAAVYFFLPASYVVFAQVQIESRQPTIVGRPGADSRGDFSTYLKTQTEKMRGRYVISAALKRPEVQRLGYIRDMADPFAWLADELKVQAQEGSELVTVSMMGPEPGDLMPLVNGIVQAYVNEVSTVELERRKSRVAELEKIQDRLMQDLRKNRDRRQKLAEQNTTDPASVTHKQLIMLSMFSEVRKQHSMARGELVRAQNRLETHKNQEKLLDDPNLPEAAITEALDADPAARQHLADVRRWEALIREYEQVQVREEASYKKAKAERDALKKQYEARREELKTDLLQRYRRQARTQYDLILSQLQNEIDLLIKQEQGLAEEVKRLGQEVEGIGRRSAELETLLADLQRDEKTEAKVTEELEGLRFELNSPPRVSVVQEAAAQRKDGKRQLMALILAPLVALLGVCLAVAWWEFRGRRIHTADEVLTGLGMRVVGALPALKNEAQVPLLGAPAEDGADHGLLESIDGIRTLLLRDAGAGTRVLMVTSAVSGEGKTTLATQLAASLARAGRRTLLLDCDLRRPSIHQMFELPPQPGLSEVLLGEVHLAEATLATPVPGLWVVPAGQWDRNVMQALAKDGAQAIFEKLKSEYDFVVVDSHPVLPTTDSLLIGQHVDAVILSVLRDVSQTPKVYAACQRLTSLGIRVLGAVINGTHQDVYGNAYDYGTPAQVS